MRFYTETHKHTCGIDLHAKTMYLCILDREGQILLHQNMRSRPETFLDAVAPYREDLVVAVECMFTWYWLADLCRREGIEFVLGHALYMKAIHGAKAKNDKLDAFKIATLLRGGNLPKAYVYPPEMRICFADGSTWSAGEGTFWPTSRTPTISTTSRSPAPRSPTRPTAKASPTLFPSPMPARAWRSTSCSSSTTTG